ncbi:MAG: hypothetical protein IPL71_22035 [Anaerolineales bacterium]|uniref:hypothetical protein n=1 Tax=Candidatus Villigracilis proximus TaxID=3140683 RepID=UPI0031352E49|nr:hypothetical protein [Anaerolineales bacterium]
MKPLAADEKIAMVMLYTPNMLVRGEVVTKENLRVSIWLRTQGVPNYIHLIKPQVILLGGTPPKSLSYSEIFIPTAEVIGFHLAPPEQDPMDYDTTETNRMMQPMEVMIGSFLAKARIRISMQTDVATSLDVSRVSWLSVYDADISNPYLPQFNVRVPMLLVNPSHVSFGMA